MKKKRICYCYSLEIIDLFLVVVFFFVEDVTNNLTAKKKVCILIKEIDRNFVRNDCHRHQMIEMQL